MAELADACGLGPHLARGAGSSPAGSTAMMDYNSTTYAQTQLISRWFGDSLFRVVQKYLQIAPGESVLEVGCNQGVMVKKLRSLGIDAYGVDINEKAVKEAAVEYVSVMDATRLDFPDNTFDKLFSLHTIEHIEDTQKVLGEMERVLKPGGRIVLMYPAEPGVLRGITCIHHALVISKNPLSARKIHVHNFNPKKIQELIKGSSLQHIESHFPVLMHPQYLTVLEKKENNAP